MKLIKRIFLTGLSALFLFSTSCSPTQEKKEISYHTIIDYQYDDMAIDENFISVKQGDLWGAYIKEGENWELKIPISYQAVGIDKGIVIACRSMELFGEDEIELYREDGTRLTDDIYSQVIMGTEDEEGIIADVEGKSGVLSLDGKWKIPPQEGRLLSLKDGTYLRFTKEKNEWIDKDGNSFLPDDTPWKVLNGAAGRVIVSNEEESLFGVIDQNLSLVIPQQYAYISVENDEKGNLFFICQNQDGTSDVLDMDGKAVLTGFPYGSQIWPAGDRLFIVQNGNHKGLVDRQGETILPATYQDIEVEGEIIRATEQDQTVWLYDIKGNKLFDTGYEKILSGDSLSCPNVIVKDGKYGYLSGNQKISVPPIYDMYAPVVYDSESHLLPVQKDGKWGFVDHQGNTVIDFLYSQAMPFYDGLSCVAKDGKVGLINEKGETVLPFSFEEKEPLPSISITYGKLAVQKDGKLGCIEFEK